jgi:integrase
MPAPDKPHVVTAQTWIARYRDKSTGRTYKALNVEVTAEGDGGYHAAKAEAEKWFNLLARGVKTDDVKTVADACALYVERRSKSKSEACGQDARKRFERTVYSDKGFSSTELTKVTADRVRNWRDGLALKPAAANRTMTTLKAALNFAAREGYAPAELLGDLRRVEPVPDTRPPAKKRRGLYLDRAQRRKLLNAAKGAVRDLIEAAILTGARAGELVNATVSQLYANEEAMTFTGKTGTREKAPLSPAAVKLFKRLAEGKAPTDLLLTRDDGKQWQHSDWDDLVREAAKGAELPTERGSGVCLYTLRHSYITDAVNAGNSMLAVAEAVGTSSAMIAKFYGKSTGAAQMQLRKLRVL